ncbi:MAG: hypothetical protein ACSLFQ_17220 [Thermoanaerobaculia bacterium]
MTIVPSLDGVVMLVSSTSSSGVVGNHTRIAFSQQRGRVFARYAGGRVRRGVLVGDVSGGALRFRYLQVEASGEIHGGRSTCDVVRTADGRLRILERFVWSTREGSGTNVFDELPAIAG